jgi:putative hemolysin
LERILHLERVRSLYGRARGTLSGKAFVDRALEVLEIDCRIKPEDLDRIPRTGPALLVSNHPFGVLDPMAVLSAALSVREDVKVLGNHLLSRIPELRDVLIPVNPFGGSRATRENARAVRDCLRLLREGHMLCMFPAGTVSHVHIRPRGPRVTDPPWNPMAARLARMAGAVVVPAYVAGRNSMVFQVAGLVHPVLRTVLLPRETVKKVGGCICVRIGRPIPPQRLERFRTDRERVAFLRSRAYHLAERLTGPSKRIPRSPSEPRLQPLAPPRGRDRLVDELRSLPPEQVLLESGGFAVLEARSVQIPTLLEEVARLRELTFRQEEEGTGAPMDTDRFDLHYRHLVLWNRERSEIAGAYRMGLSEEILPAFGPRGFYTHSLFHFGRRFLDRIGPAIELGRSFVRTEYQKSYQPLFLLWKGIARFVSLNPQYRHLFGPVSITRAYRSRSRQIMAAFLEENNRVTETARLVRPRRPFRRGPLKVPELRGALDGVGDLQELSDLISEIEGGRKGVPVLIRQYLRLGGMVLGFNVDPLFRDALDALVLLDLAQTDRKTLVRYMGADGADAFLRIHAGPPMARCA